MIFYEDDLIDIIIKSIEYPRFTGIFNCVAPERVSNKKFSRILAKSLGRFSYPNFIKAPSLIIKLLFGGQSVLILNGLNVSSKKIVKSNFNFKYPKLSLALKALYSK